MLILTRKLGESINIGEEIKISVLGINGRQVRIGIEAPMNIVVHREEIYVKIQEENRKASGTITTDIKEMVKKIKGKISGKGSENMKPLRYDKNSKKTSTDNDKHRS